ncbi:hypothetical protein [Vibrio sp. SCSIO 43136]|uniref:hypothetical protein n=1 Tax=Vibrio sp. SCSIO 43136 TaxID=2819101 RepID=UPI002075D86A|nr:hypothetical protein [Vibrio sp. SCSIO 43136]USD66781.1 hypothetical protein J4N39_19180 [Vibrio sp. SCSIO 43136]
MLKVAVVGMFTIGLAVGVNFEDHITEVVEADNLENAHEQLVESATDMADELYTKVKKALN